MNLGRQSDSLASGPLRQQELGLYLPQNAGELRDLVSEWEAVPREVDQPPQP